MIPENYHDLLNAPVVVTVVTVMPDGQPQATPVWVSFDGELIWVNTAAGRQKDINMLHNPKVTVGALDPENPYRWIEVRGVVTERTTEGALDHIDELARLYFNAPRFYSGPRAELEGKEERVIFKIKPQKVNARG